MKLSVCLSVSVKYSSLTIQCITESYQTLWYSKPVKTGICDVLLNKSFNSKQTQRTGSNNFTPCLYFHESKSSISSVASHCSSWHICHALHCLIQINSGCPQPSSTAQQPCFRLLVAVNNMKKFTYSTFNSFFPHLFLKIFVWFICMHRTLLYIISFFHFFFPWDFQNIWNFQSKLKKLLIKGTFLSHEPTHGRLLVVFKCPLSVHAEPKSAGATLIKVELIINSWIGPQLRHMLRMNY